MQSMHVSQVRIAARSGVVHGNRRRDDGPGRACCVMHEHAGYKLSDGIIVRGAIMAGSHASPGEYHH